MTTEREFRRKRLKALGNAVVPAQVYPILCAIAWEVRRALRIEIEEAKEEKCRS